MSVERLVRSDGAIVWRVRWRQGARNRSKVLGRKHDAEVFDAELRRRKRTGVIALLDAGKQPLWEFGEEGWRLYVRPNLAPATLELYAMLWETHILPRLGGLSPCELTPERLNGFRLELEADGVGRVSVRKALTLLHGVLRRACERGRIASNPVATVPKPPGGRTRSVHPLPPETVQQIRSWLLRRSLLRDATLVSVLAYGGLRPGEALALTWAHVRERTILVEAAVSIGRLAETKTRRRRSSCSHPTFAARPTRRRSVLASTAASPRAPHAVREPLPATTSQPNGGAAANLGGTLRGRRADHSSTARADAEGAGPGPA